MFLSYLLDDKTPTYGNRNRFDIEKKSDISKGDVANDSSISTTVHIGTHIDMPLHFFDNAQTIKDFDADFWLFQNPLFIEIEPSELVIKDELIHELESISENNYDILIVKTGICNIRGTKQFWDENYGFHPGIYEYLREYFPQIRVFGFDSISVSSFQNRMLGREAHKAFLNPNQPILLLEDMDLTNISSKTNLKEIIVSPLRIANCDGMPCTVFGKIYD